MTHFVKPYIITKRPSFNQIVMSFLMKIKTFAFWFPFMTHKANLALFLNLIGDATVFTHHIFEQLWFRSFSFVAWKFRLDQSGASLLSPGFELDLLNLIFCISDTTVAMKLAWILMQNSLLLGVRFSSINFSQQNIWQKLHDNSCSN